MGRKLLLKKAQGLLRLSMLLVLIAIFYTFYCTVYDRLYVALAKIESTYQAYCTLR